MVLPVINLVIRRRRMKMTTILFLLFLLLIPSLVVGQTSRSTDAAANKSWPKYYSSFRAAVRNRDRRSLETMMLASYDCRSFYFCYFIKPSKENFDREFVL